MLFLQRALREDFGFQHFMFVYSGRRGVHCWVSDPAAQTLNNDQRGAIIEYLSLLNTKTLELMNCKLDRDKFGTALHPVIRKAQTILEPVLLERILPEQEPLKPRWEKQSSSSGGGAAASSSPENTKMVQTNKHVSCVEQALEAIAGSAPTVAGAHLQTFKKLIQKPTCRSSDVWNLLQEAAKSVKNSAATGAVAQAQQTTATQAAEELELLGMETSFRLVFPRWDVNVTKQMNHLAKSPFCIHPKTGKVCVPIPNPDRFNFETVPTLGQLNAELNKGVPLAQCSLAGYLVFFKRYCDGVDKARAAFKARAATGGKTTKKSGGKEVQGGVGLDAMEVDG